MSFNFENLNITISGLQNHYANNDFTPSQLCEYLLKANVLENSENPVWITLLSAEQLKSYTDKLDSAEAKDLPLYGVPFAIKDNIDLAGVVTTAGCPDFKYMPEKSAFVVQTLIDAGAIPLGKTNLDQFATGLVGVRSPEPWGPVKNSFDSEYVSGGSSSGSAVSVAKGLASFSLGTDTAGSGRVPAGFNNLVGLKPSRGVFSNSGMVRACRSIDCITVFALTSDDACRVFDVAAKEDQEDEYSRKLVNEADYEGDDKPFVFGVPKPDQLQFFGDDEYQNEFSQTLESLKAAGGQVQELDIQPLLDAAKLLYQGPWISERTASVGEFINKNPGSALPVIENIIATGHEFSAVHAFKAEYQMQLYRKIAKQLMTGIDCLVTPTTGTHYKIVDVLADPIALNSNLGYYTNFMNLVDFAAVATPASILPSKRSFGITLCAQAFSDRKLLGLSNRIQQQQQLSLGATQLSLPVSEQNYSQTDTIDVVVCGAHLEGLPLNHQLTSRGAYLIESTHSSSDYRFYALAGGPPKRPGMIRVASEGCAIAVEVWRVPASEFGGFVAGIPTPLGIGKVQLADGRWEAGFICEAFGIEGAEDISHLGSWRTFVATLNG